MKHLVHVFAFITLTFGLGTAQADPEDAWNLLADIEARAAKCAGNDKDKANIAAITKKVNLFGSWKGTLNEKTATAKFYKDGSGNYKATAEFDGSDYGPYGIKVCDDNGSFYATAFGYEATFVVLSKTKIKVYSPLDSSETVVLTKQ